MAKIRRGAAGWAALIDEWRDSGLSLPVFCESHVLKLATMQGRVYERPHRLAIKRLRAQAHDEPVPSEDPPTTALLPVHLAEPVTVAGSGVEVVLGLGRRIAVALGFDPETSRRVVAVLEDRPC